MTNIAVKQIDLTENFEQLLEIWCICFPEDADFGQIFLKQAAPNAKIFGVMQNGALLSCAYCLPSDLHVDNRQFSAYYVYGVGTLPMYRGKGYAKRLLEYIKSVLLADVLFLYPAKPSLRAFYEGLGYRSVLYRTEQDETQLFNGEVPYCAVVPFDAQSYAIKRASFLATHAAAFSVFDTITHQTLLEHAQILTCEDNTALCIVEEDTVYVPELLCEETGVPALLAAVKQQFSGKRVVAYTAGTDTASGMLLPCSTKAKTYFKDKQCIPFFGTFFAE